MDRQDKVIFISHTLRTWLIEPEKDSNRGEIMEMSIPMKIIDSNNPFTVWDDRTSNMYNFRALFPGNTLSGWQHIVRPRS